jgi:hypothetical protein
MLKKAPTTNTINKEMIKVLEFIQIQKVNRKTTT